jgi:hypothetical protein
MILTSLQAQSRYFATGDSTSTDFATADVNRQLNSNYNQLTILAFSASKEWQYRGNNSQAISITAGTRNYALPDTFLRINRVEIKYPSSSDYIKAEATDSKIIETGLDKYTSGTPQFDLKGNKLDIFVSDETASIKAVTSGIIVYYDNEITELSGGTDEPDLPEPFSRLLCLMTARDYCGVNNMNNRLSWINSEIAKEEARFVEFLSTRNEAKRLRITAKQEDWGQGEVGNRSVNWQ